MGCIIQRGGVTEKNYKDQQTKTSRNTNTGLTDKTQENQIQNIQEAGRNRNHSKHK